MNSLALGFGGVGDNLTAMYLTDPKLAQALRKQQYAYNLLNQSQDNQPVISPWQGVNKLAQALLGGYLLNKTDAEVKAAGDAQDKETADFNARIAPLLMGGSSSPAPAPEPAAPPVKPAVYQAPGDLGPLVEQASASSGVPASQLARYLMRESGGDPNAANPTSTARGVAQILQSTAENPGYGVPPLAASDRMVPEKAVPWLANYVAARGKAAGVTDWNDPAQAGKIWQAVGDGTPAAAAVAQARGGQPAASAAPDADDMLTRAQALRSEAFNSINSTNPQIRQRGQFLTHYADSLERQALSIKERAQKRQDQIDDRALRASERIPSTITMQDPDGKGVGIYEMTPSGPGRRLGNAPKQPGEATGPFAGTGMDAQANNILLGIGPKIAGGTATDAEKAQYALAYQHIQNGKMQWMPDPSDPSGQRQIMTQVPGQVPSQFPAPPGMAAAAPGSAGAPFTKTTQASEADRLAAGFSLRMNEASKTIDDLEGRGTHTGNAGSATFGSLPGVGNYLRSTDNQVYLQKAQDWVRAKLRKESGAAIGEKEMADEIRTYFPQPGDSAAVIAAKKQSRKIAEAAMQGAAGKTTIEAPAAAAMTGIPAPPPGFRVVQ